MPKQSSRRYASVMLRVSKDFATVIRRVAERDDTSVVQVTRELSEFLKAELGEEGNGKD